MKSKILQNFLQKYSDFDFIDIEEIIKENGVKIIEADTLEIEWIFIKFLKDPTIFISKNLTKKEKRFVLWHEFCHFLLWEVSLSINCLNQNDFIEKRANNFSVDLLIPTKKLLELYQEYENIPTLSDIFWVPEKVIEYKLNNLICKI